MRVAGVDSGEGKFVASAEAMEKQWVAHFEIVIFNGWEIRAVAKWVWCGSWRQYRILQINCVVAEQLSSNHNHI
jgi:hypothetical protein